MSRISVLIEGVDFSTFFNKYGATFHYEERLGANGGMMLDGSETVDVLARKLVWDLVCNDLSDSDLVQLLPLCCRDYVTVTCPDPATGQTKTAKFIPSVGRASTLLAENGVQWFTGLALSFREK